VTPARCRKVNDGVSREAKLLIEAPVNGGRNFLRVPKVAEIPLSGLNTRTLVEWGNENWELGSNQLGSRGIGVGGNIFS